MALIVVVVVVVVMFVIVVVVVAFLLVGDSLVIVVVVGTIALPPLRLSAVEISMGACSLYFSAPLRSLVAFPVGAAGTANICSTFLLILSHS